MKFGSLFAGIGGIDLGLERAGMTCAWQVEIDRYCLKVLEKHWPDVKRYEDVRKCGKHNLETVDLIAGGFPCQPHSVAGKRRGAEDDRNLWPEFSRVIAELKPRYVFAENVPGIVATYIDTVLSDLESKGYITTTFNIPAVAFNAPHRRERIFIVAHSREVRRKRFNGIPQGFKCGAGRNAQRKPDAHGSFSSEDVAYTARVSRDCTNPSEQGKGAVSKERFDGDWWTVEPGVGGSSHGFPLWLEQHIGRGMSYEKSTRATEVLRELWNDDVAETLWKAIGGFDRVQKSEILFAIVCEYQKNPDEARILLESTKALEKFVRSLWRQEKITGSSYRPANRKQSGTEYSDSVQIVSRLLAFNGEENWQISDWEDGISRVATGVPSRVDRLKSLGNAVVPVVAEWIGKRIMEFDNESTRSNQ